MSPIFFNPEFDITNLYPTYGTSDRIDYSYDVLIATQTSNAPYRRNYYYQNSLGDSIFREKVETNKQKLIRQRAAFKMFYSKPSYSPRKRRNVIESEFKESCERINKFKSINENLII